ncbi:unnamed protein product, partial [Mesorhabditis spiculigera]
MVTWYIYGNWDKLEKRLVTGFLSRSMLRACSSLRAVARFASEDIKRKTFVSANGLVVAWHPPSTFPFEHTKPIDLQALNPDKEEGPLKEGSLQQRPRAPVNAELKEIFYTTKHECRRAMLLTTRLSSIQIIRPGLVSYAQGLLLQEDYIKKVAESKDKPYSSNYLLCLEHSPVYTVGIRSKVYSDDEEKHLKSLGADFHRTSRGGLITFHGPGQLVVYPILDLRRFSPRRFGVRAYVDALEQAVIDCVSEDFNVSGVGRSRDNTGVWVGDNRKICAMGIAVKEGITSHGLAMNCNTDLRWFSHIVACGIHGAEATSLSRETGSDVSTDMVIPLFAARLSHVFDCSVDEASPVSHISNS